MTGGRTFASDNNAGVHPAVLDAIAAANVGHVHAYGDDPYTSQAVGHLRRHLGEQVAVYFTFNGTGANVSGLSALMRSYEACICPESAHINLDECGAVERLSGGRLLTVPTPDGKLTPELVEGRIWGVGVEHHSQPRVVSITQATEYGTVYTPDEVRAIAEVAHAHGLWLHMDGARIANAAASLECTLRDITLDAGVDVLSFGGTKNGILMGEAVVFADPEMAVDFAYVRKQNMQLASKMRFIAVQFAALLEGDLWLKNARHANAMAALLAERMAEVPGIEISQSVQANEVFARMPAGHIAALQAVADFYVWDERNSEVRWVTSWDTTEEDVETFAAAARAGG
ncbi:MAG: low specificity L-threonine aldolase [Coriobacteriia bacterium]|nr:low specificity L-threonine aldolase [Coriobacteriia bacterium]